MILVWTQKSKSDIARLHDFIAAVNSKAATHIVQSIAQAVSRLLEHPRMGEKLERYHTREVRRFIIGYYELRYEIRFMTIRILRIWHTREYR